jgi:hypothetical protein
MRRRQYVTIPGGSIDWGTAMDHPFRNTRVAATASAAIALIATLIAAGPAAADELTVKNNADVPVKVVVKNGSQEVGHTDRIDKKSAGKVTLNSGVSLAKITPSVEAAPLGVNTRCSVAKSGSQYEVKCDPVAANAPAAPAEGNKTTEGGKPASRNLEVQNDLKDAVTVYIEYALTGKIIRDEHDINSRGSAFFTITLDNDNPTITVNILRHVDMQRINCGAMMRYDIPTSRQKVYVTPAAGSSPPEHEGRADSKPCVLSQASNVEKAGKAPGGGGTAEGDSTATRLVVENDLKDPVQISILGPLTEEHTIEPRQSLAFPKPVLHEKGEKGGMTMEVFISRAVDMRMIRCGASLRYVIPPIPEVKFFVTRVAGSAWPPRATPGGQSGEPGAAQKGKLPGAPSCELTRAQNLEK